MRWFASVSLGPLQVWRNVFVHFWITCSLLVWLWLGCSKLWGLNRSSQAHILQVLDISDNIRKASLHAQLLTNVILRPFDFFLLLWTYTCSFTLPDFMHPLLLQVLIISAKQVYLLPLSLLRHWLGVLFEQVKSSPFTFCTWNKIMKLLNHLFTAKI